MAAVTWQGAPVSSNSVSPTWTPPIVVQPVGVGSGVSRASALPTWAEDMMTTVSVPASEIALMIPR